MVAVYLIEHRKGDKMILEMNAQGEYVQLNDFLEERNQRLYDVVDEKAEQIKIESTTAKGRSRMGAKLSTVLYTYFAKEPLMSRATYVNLDGADINTYFAYYMEMLSHYNEFEVSSTRQLFCQYMRISVAKYNDLMNSADVDIQESMAQVNDTIDGLIFAQAESSSNNATATLTRARTSEVGQGHTVQKEEITFNTGDKVPTALLLQKAQQIMAEKQKQLGEAKR